MSRFIDNAVEIFEAAEMSLQSGHTPSQYSILLGARGGIRMIADSDWSLDSLQREHGAATAYRISTAGGGISIDGRDGNRSCHLETQTPAHVAQFLLNSPLAWQSRS